MQKTWYYIDYKKDTCLQYESWNKKRMSPCLTSSGNTHVRGLKFFSVLPLSLNDRKSSVSIDFGVTNTLASRQIWNSTKSLAQHMTWTPPINVNHCCSGVIVVKTSPCPCQGLRHREATTQQLLETPVLPTADVNQRKYFLAHWSSLISQIESVVNFSQVAPVSPR